MTNSGLTGPPPAGDRGCGATGPEVDRTVPRRPGRLPSLRLQRRAARSNVGYDLVAFGLPKGL